MTSGLVLMNLTRMRELGLEQRLTELDRETAAPGRRGDMLSNLFTGRPEALRTFSCCWHFHSGHCNGSALCIDGPVAAVRGSQQVPAFAALRDSMRQVAAQLCAFTLILFAFVRKRNRETTFADHIKALAHVAIAGQRAPIF